jgi:hypothetical protein
MINNREHGRLLNEVIAFVSGDEVVSFTIGYTSKNPKTRVHEQDHVLYGREEVKVVKDKMTRDEAIDLEEFLNREAQNPKYQGTAFYEKNDKKNVPPLRSIGGAPGTPADEKVHAVYIAWGRPKPSRRAAQGEGKTGSSRPDALQGVAKVSVFYKDDAGFLRALENGDRFFASTRKGAREGNQPPQLHFHKKDCPRWKLTRRGQNPNPYTGIRIKVTSTDLTALYKWMQQRYPERFGHKHVCTWCNI